MQLFSGCDRLLKSNFSQSVQLSFQRALGTLLIKFSFGKKVGAFICISKLDGMVTRRY